MKEYIISENLVVCSEYKIAEDPQFWEYLQSEDLQNFLQEIDNDILIVIWWDGSMLEAVASYYPKRRKFFGINYGNKWFLLHPQSVLKISSPKLISRKYPLISLRDDSSLHYAFNELDIKAWDGKMLDMKLQVHSNHSLNILWDGLLISTPAGSTWYNSSLWGPILSHDLNSYIITPKASWKPRNLESIILSNSQTLELSTSGRENTCEIYADWRLSASYDAHIDLEIKILEEEIELYIEQSYLRSWDDKILVEQGFSQS